MTERIEKIKEYFKAFNIEGSYILVSLEFKKSWIVPDEQILKQEYNVEHRFINNLHYFCTELTNGYDTLFDCIDGIISTNIEIAKKSDLMKEKANELVDFFNKHTYEELKTMAFVLQSELNEVKEVSITPKKTKVKKPSKAKSDKKTKVNDTIENVVPTQETQLVEEKTQPQENTPREILSNNEITKFIVDDVLDDVDVTYEGNVLDYIKSVNGKGIISEEQMKVICAAFNINYESVDYHYYSGEERSIKI